MLEAKKSHGGDNKKHSLTHQAGYFIYFMP